MAVKIRIISEFGLAYVQFEGMVRLNEAIEAFRAYSMHPKYKPGQKQLVDFANITGFEKDFVGIMTMHAEMAETLVGSPAQTLMLFYGPTPVSRSLASVCVQCWPPDSGVIACMQDTEATALDVLGVSLSRFADLPNTQDLVIEHIDRA